MELVDDPLVIGRALAWLVGVLERGQVPYQIVGGLAAQAYGATRPLVDIDLYAPLDRLEPVLGDLRPYLKREPLPHRSDAWDLVYLALQYEGVWIEIGDTNTPALFYNRVDGRWEQQVIDYAAAVRARLYGVEVNVMPKSELARYKAMLNREVDTLDLAEMGGQTGEPHPGG